MQLSTFFHNAGMLPNLQDYAPAAGPLIGPVIPNRPISIGAYRERSFAEIQAASRSNSNNNYLAFAARPEIFAVLSQLDGGGTPDAALPQNWSLLDWAATAGASALMTQSGMLSKRDVEHWEALDGLAGLSAEDNRIIEEAAKRLGLIFT